MHCAEDDSPPYISYQNGPYNSSLASSASSSTGSIWSDAASHSSDDSSVTSTASARVTPETYCFTVQQGPSFVPAGTSSYPAQYIQPELPVELRQNPRRTSAGSRVGPPPLLTRQSDRKISFVDSLVDSSAQIVEAIWPLSSVPCRTEAGQRGCVLSLRKFIQETLRRSRTSYSTLQVALYYLILIKPHVPKTDFTMQQTEDASSVRALQCGRRMFLAALILASKYLQDRNYSARAWSKISGLNTLEINQNEITFLLAVEWRIHITDAVFQRWTNIVLKYTPEFPSAPGAAPLANESSASQSWKAIILKLNPELDNIEEVKPNLAARASIRSLSASQHQKRSYTPMTPSAGTFGFGSAESTPTANYRPHTIEPTPTAYIPNKAAPALGLLPTPRLTPQSIGYNTPAVSAASYMLKPSMGFAMAGAMASASAAQTSDKWQPYLTSSPQSYSLNRRSSLANSVSYMSSPESMVSDSSRNSRSSSISSASSLTCAPASSKLDVQARCRYAKLCSEKQNRTFIATVPEHCDNGPTSSPESYTGPVGKELHSLSLDTPLARRNLDLDQYAKDEEAARVLQELHNNPRESSQGGTKRGRSSTMDASLQESVREILNTSSTTAWSNDLRAFGEAKNAQLAIQTSTSGRKRVCCATESAREYSQSRIHPAFGGFGGPGMWAGILN